MNAIEFGKNIGDICVQNKYSFYFKKFNTDPIPKKTRPELTFGTGFLYVQSVEIRTPCDYFCTLNVLSAECIRKDHFLHRLDADG